MDGKRKVCVIENYGYDGEGVARIDGKVTFVPFTLKDEEVEVEITDDRSSFMRGELKKVISSSKERTIPPCPYFGKCGGCTLQHTNYQNELKIKKQLLQGQLKKVGYSGTIETFGSTEEYGYRNKIKLFVGKDSLSLKRRGSDKLYKIIRCLLVSDLMNDAIKAIDSFFKAQNLYDEFVQVLLREENQQLLVVFYRKRAGKEINYQGIYLILGRNTGIYESFDNKFLHKVGLKALECVEHGLKCKFSPNSFHQVNRFVGDKLYNYVTEVAEGKRIANCYSGAGVLSGILTNGKRQVFGLELGESEHQDAEILKEENNLRLLTNLQGDCSELLPRLEDLDCVVVDPPRAGLAQKVVDTLNNMNCKKLIYISCNSATLVRDISRLYNFKLLNAKLFDMFARTGEYEVVAVLGKEV